MPNSFANQSGKSIPGFTVPFVAFFLILPAFILMILIILVGMQYKQYRAFVSPTPVEIPYVEDSPVDEDKVVAKVRDFFNQDSLDTLALSAVDLNRLVRANPVLESMGLRYHLELEDSLFVVRNSMSTDGMGGFVTFSLKLMRVKGYFNSVMKGYPKLADGKIELVPVYATMNGQVAPVKVIQRGGNVNPRDWVSDQAAYDAAFRNLADIKVKSGALLLIRKP